MSRAIVSLEAFRVLRAMRDEVRARIRGMSPEEVAAAIQRMRNGEQGVLMPAKAKAVSEDTP